MRYHCPHVHQASTKQNMTAELEWAGKRWLHRLEMKMEMKTNVVYGTNNLELSIKIINIPTLKPISLFFGICSREIKTVIRKDTQTHL